MIAIDNVYGIIYCATNKINNKKYIGQTVRDLETRKREHIANANNDGQYAFHCAIRKHGEENFTWSVLDTADGIEELDEKEIYWIKHFNTYYDGGYNMALGGRFNLSDDPDEMSAMRGGREFLVFDIEGNFIAEITSQTEFADEIGVSIQTVNHVLTGRKNSTGGYVLFFKDKFSEDILNSKIKQIEDRYKDFAVFDLEWNLIGVWDNKAHCSKDLKSNRGAIINQLNNIDIAKNARRYKYYYLENIPDQYKHKVEIKDVI